LTLDDVFDDLEGVLEYLKTEVQTKENGLEVSQEVLGEEFENLIDV
jgi:hypothetical protein